MLFMRCFVSEVFGSIYAEAYDILYHDKDYKAECDLIERIVTAYGQGSIRSILDLGCGTGNHAIPLAQKGYQVVGVDRSESMLIHARKKSGAILNNNSLTFHQSDLRSVDLGQRFDAALMMFAVLSYQLENSDVLSAFRAARRHLCPGGLLIFDAWYGPAVLHQRPSQQVKVIPTPEGQVLRVASGELDIQRHLCTVNYQLWRVEKERLVAETKERHSVRYFFPLELNLFMECAQFSPIRLGGFPNFDEDADQTTWNILVVARAV
jgi:SAM-dependent methyltransferase